MKEMLKKENEIVLLIFLSLGIMTCSGLSLLALQYFFSNQGEIGQVMARNMVSLFWMVIIPYIVMNKLYGLNLEDLGLVRIPTKKIIGLIGLVLLMAFLISYLYDDIGVFFLSVIANLFIAFSEEFLARGVYIWILRRIRDNDLFVYLVNAIIFVFVFHSDASIMENLIWRLPFTIIILLAYHKTKRLYLPIAIHFLYNIFVVTIN